MAFRFDKLTIKAQEAVQRAKSWRPIAAIRRSSRCICWRRCSARPKASSVRCSKRSAPTAQQLEKIDRRRARPFAQASGGAPAAARAKAWSSVLEAAAKASRHDEGRVRLDRASAAGADEGRFQGQERAQAQRHRREATCSRPCKPSAAARASTDQNPGRASSRPWKSTASTWSNGPATASSIR